MRGHKTIYLLPNLITTAALFCGFSSILSALNGDFQRAATMLFWAMIFDGFDGRVARWTKTESAFGVQYDSLSDLISFGVAPALLMYQWSLHLAAKMTMFPARLGAMAAFIYTACTALRLARFNVQSESSDKSVFIGLPSPAAAAVLASFVWLAQRYQWQAADWVGLSLALTFGAAAAMVSDLKYYSFKTFKLESRIPFTRVFLPMSLIALILLEPSLTLFSIFIAYALHAPVWLAWRSYSRRRH